MGAYYSVEEKSVENSVDNSVDNRPDMESPEIENVSDDMEVKTNMDSHFLNWWF
jgi:hypothetical protein